MNKVQKYIPMVRVELKDGRVLYTPESNHGELIKTIEKSKFVTIEGITINVFEIKTIEKASVTDYDLTENLDMDQKEQFEIRVNEFRRNLNRLPSRDEKMKFISKIFGKK